MQKQGGVYTCSNLKTKIFLHYSLVGVRQKMIPAKHLAWGNSSIAPLSKSEEEGGCVQLQAEARQGLFGIQSSPFSDTRCVFKVGARSSLSI